MVDANYISGKGLDVSLVQKIPEARHVYINAGNLYLLRNEVGIEEFDYLYSKDSINQTKYYRILLYEWFLVVKPGGYLILDFKDNKILSCMLLKKELNSLLLYRDKYEIVFEEKIGNRKKIIIKKIKSIKISADEINQWTFGIITNGKRPDFMKKAIESIRSLGVPNYEIIICGTYSADIQKVKYMHFTEKDNKGWITKKKNLICENAKYKNICIIHDRIYFNKDWFAEMKKYGNYFDVLSFPVCDTQKVKSKYPYSNWGAIDQEWNYDRLVYGLNITGGQLSPDDWDKNCWVGGAAIALKKHIWKLTGWNEDLFWREYEDIELSHRQHRSGVMIRFNFFAKSYSMTMSQLTIFGVPYYKRNEKRLGRYSINPIIIGLVRMLELVGLRKNSYPLLYIKRKLAEVKKIKTSMDKI